MQKDEIVAMAVAAIAEELGTDVRRVRVASFRESGDEQEDKMSTYRIKMNGKTYEMEVELIEEGKPREAVHAPVVNKNVIKAPMPGSIIRVVANSGDSVNENDVVLVLEAMKMENEVCAPRSGRIKRILVSEGQNVSADAPLFEMED